MQMKPHGTNNRVIDFASASTLQCNNAFLQTQNQPPQSVCRVRVGINYGKWCQPQGLRQTEETTDSIRSTIGPMFCEEVSLNLAHWESSDALARLWNTFHAWSHFPHTQPTLLPPNWRRSLHLQPQPEEMGRREREMDVLTTSCLVLLPYGWKKAI